MDSADTENTSFTLQQRTLPFPNSITSPSHTTTFTSRHEASTSKNSEPKNRIKRQPMQSASAIRPSIPTHQGNRAPYIPTRGARAVVMTRLSRRRCRCRIYDTKGLGPEAGKRRLEKVFFLSIRVPQAIQIMFIAGHGHANTKCNCHTSSTQPSLP
jgi:hypothetical protein